MSDAARTSIRARARELGFDDCRFTDASPPPHAGAFARWIEAGRHGEMAWLQRNAAKRVDPAKVLIDAESIVVVAASYHLEETGAPSGAGVIARYARHVDYHDVLGGRLKELSAFIEGLEPGARSLWYVDTGPLLERDLAQRAGLGFAGKHTNLIHRRLGNWIFLGAIVTTLALEPDPPEPNHCGKCQRCIVVCPTAAITAPFQLDARRCISYLTIELKGPIPVELRPGIGNRIYGCDDCLAVCPWNRFARDGALMRRHRRTDLDAPALLDLLALDETGFQAKFAGTPVLRTKRRGLLRNTCVALGNTAGAEALPALERAAATEEALVAEHATWAVEQIRSRKG